MSGSHAKPITIFNPKKILFAILFIAVLSLSAVGAWQMYLTEDEIIPAGVSSFEVKVNLSDVTSAAANKQDMRQMAEKETKVIEGSVSEYLSGAFIQGTVKSPMAPKFIKANKNLIPIKGSARLDNLYLIYDQKNNPILAITQIDFSSKYYLPKNDKQPEKETFNRQFEYGFKGELVLKKTNEWKITSMKLDSNTKEYKVVEE